MGAYTDELREQSLKEALSAPAVAAASGFYVLDEKWPDQEPEPVLAWRLGPDHTLPVTRAGCSAGDFWVLHPDGKVRVHCRSYGSETPCFQSVEAWRDDARSRSVTNGEPTGNVVSLKSPRGLRIKVEGCFGGCPVCGRADEQFNAGKTNILVCHAHKTSWIFGAGFGGGDESEAEQRERYRQIEDYARVEPLPPGEWSADPETQRRELDAAAAKAASNIPKGIRGDPAGDDDFPF